MLESEQQQVVRRIFDHVSWLLVTAATLTLASKLKNPALYGLGIILQACLFVYISREVTKRISSDWNMIVFNNKRHVITSRPALVATVCICIFVGSAMPTFIARALEQIVKIQTQ